MGEIQILPETIANQIAAGEVVERPASIVKELAENAVDAGATRIDIEIENGGLERITVSDNGRGMSPADAELAFARHATSKLRTADDLFCITSLGFRGEALPSIASVAQVELVTRQPSSDAAYKVVVRGGQHLDSTPWGAPPGTRVTVTDLFYNTPARQKFLSSPRAEAGRVRDLVTKLALTAPSIAFRLTQDGRIVLETPGDAKLKDAILALYGNEVAQQMIAVEQQTAKVTIQGLISRPDLTRNNRRDQVFVINGRLVQCRSLAAVLQEAYRSLLPSGRHPLAFLQLNLPPNLVDVNVHPAKIEVRLSEERQIAAIVLRTLRETLASAGQVDAAATTEWRPSAIPSPFQLAPERQMARPQLVSELAAEPMATEKPHVPISFYRPKTDVRPISFSRPEVRAETEVEIVADSVGTNAIPYRVLGQVLQSYIVVEREGALLLVDQHAAHERVIYEQLTQQDSERVVTPLLMPYTLEVGAREAGVLESAQAELLALGFEVEHFGGSTWALRSIPQVYRGRFLPEEFFDLLADLAEGWHGLKPEAQRERVLIRLACTGAIKAGQKLHTAEMIELLDQLWHTQLPFTCPHGRPTALQFNADQLYRLFHP